jgi:D-alanine-D-alanine ligase-like ATP-grasp enzyme
MVNVAFVAPFLRPATLRFLRAVLAVPGARVGLISHDRPDGIDPALRSALVGWGQMGDGLDAGAILLGARRLQEQMGPTDRLLGMLEQLQVPLAQVREELGVPGMGVEEALNFRDKARMKETLRAAGLPCARHRLVEDVASGLDFAREVGFPVVVKPPAGAGAVATVRCGDANELKAALQGMHPSARNPTLVEEFMLGLERSFEVVSIDGEPVWHSLTRYAPPPLDVLRNPWIQWTVTLPREVEHPAYDEVRHAGFAALKALGMGTGLSHMEWFRRQDGSIAISEIAARPPGAQIMGLMGWSTGRDLFAAWAQLMIHGTFDPPVRTHAAGVAFFRAMGAGRVVAVHGLDEAQKAVGHLVVESELPRVGQPRGTGYEGEGWAIVRAERTETVDAALAKLITTVRVEVG